MEKNGGMDAAVRDLQTLFERGGDGGLSDGQLLDRFVDRREEAVFEAIVRRHGPMVWGVCRRVLRDHHDAEDAFQATFLVLARKAASVMPREKVGNWLYGVAHQTAMKARAMRAKRRVREGQVTDMPEPEAVSQDHAGRPGRVARPGVEPPAREVPHPHRPVRPGGQDPQGGGEPTRLADRDGLEPPVEGQGDAGEAAVPAGRVALGRDRWRCCWLRSRRRPACRPG